MNSIMKVKEISFQERILKLCVCVFFYEQKINSYISFILHTKNGVFFFQIYNHLSNINTNSHQKGL